MRSISVVSHQRQKFLTSNFSQTTDLQRRLDLLKTGSHNLYNYLNKLNAEKISAQWSLEPQATCNLGMHLNIVLYTSYYAGIMLNAFSGLLCSQSCRLIRRVLTYKAAFLQSHMCKFHIYFMEHLDTSIANYVIS